MSSRDAHRLTTTSYAILGLLATRSWSTYELTKQLRRSIHHAWPRADSNIYAEPKRLVELGLAKSERQTVGRRPRTVYTITPKGRRALASWIGSESSPTRFESETLVKVLFGNYGTKDELLANLRRFADEAAAARALWKEIADDYVRGTYSFPERAHVNALFFRLMWEQVTTQARWAEWAIEEVEQWPDTAEPADLEASLDVFRSVLSRV
jgi:PadR family transcriptional regulator, regulatory protein AphA